MCSQPGSVRDIVAASRFTIKGCSNEGQLYSKSSNACIDDHCKVEGVDTTFQLTVMGTATFATLGLLGVFSADSGTLLLYKLQLLQVNNTHVDYTS